MPPKGSPRVEGAPCLAHGKEGEEGSNNSGKDEREREDGGGGWSELVAGGRKVRGAQRDERGGG